MEVASIEIDGKAVNESDDIIEELEKTFGALNGYSMRQADVVEIRNLERQLFGAWCQWLC